jgi:hypothetical protein
MPVTPNLQLKAMISDFSESEYWSLDDNTGDIFIGSPYRWTVKIDIQPQAHSNHTTQEPMFYTGKDVKVGDWFASGAGGRANQIIEITSQDTYVVNCVIEDIERYNLFTDPAQTGNGLCDPFSNGIIFRIAENGLPILGPIEELYMPTQAVDDLMARFIARDLTDQSLVNQPDHGFFPGDVIYADFETDFGYKKVTAQNFDRAVGIVTEIGVPGLSYFKYRPLGKLITNVNPPLWGQHGDVFYLDPNEPGALTNVKPEGKSVAVYLQLELPTKAVLLERGSEISGSGSSESETNKYDVENVTSGQTTFMMPSDAKEILYMAINGIENENFTFNLTTKVLVFDPVETGYGVDVDDEVFFIYKT